MRERFIIILCFIIIFSIGCSNTAEENISSFDTYDVFNVVTSEIDETLLSLVMEEKQKENVLNMFDEDGTDLKEEYKEALGLEIHEPEDYDLSFGVDLVYYGQPFCIYYMRLSPGEDSSMSKSWIVPVFMDFSSESELLGCFRITTTNDIYSNDYMITWESLLTDWGMYDSLLFDYENVSRIFSGEAGNIYIKTVGGVLLCNERGWFPLFKDPRLFYSEECEYTASELTAFVTQYSYKEICHILEDDFGETLKCVNIRDKHKDFVN